MTLAGTPVGFVASVEGGEPYGEVVAEAPVAGKIGKHIGNVAFEPIVVEVGAAMAKPFLDWINACLDGRFDRRDGAIGFLDYRMEERTRLEWTAGLITEVVFPAADGSLKEAVTMRVTIQPEQSRLVAGSGAAAKLPSGAQAQKAVLASNFKFSVTGLAQALNKVVKVAPIEVTRRPSKDEIGEAREIATVDVIDVGNVAIWVPVADLTPVTSWFDDFVIAGHNDATQERTGSLTFLGPNLQDELFRVDLAGLGIVRITHERLESRGEVIARAKVEMYCESVHLATAATAAAPPPTPPGDTGSSAVDSLVGALADALRPPSARPIPTAEALAARLLASVEPVPPTDDGDVGRAAGREWASDFARLDELEAIAALADRDGWKAFALGEGHTLVTFLAGRGHLPADEIGPIDLIRDDFTSGVVSGAAEIYRAVAPTLGERRPPA